MLTSYRRVLAEPGTLRFSATGLVARLPMSMVSLGIVLLVSSATGSYGLAGSVSAAYLLANATLAVVQGRLIDGLGQSRVLPVATAVFAVALALLMTAVQAGWPEWSAYVLAAVSGGALPSVGSCVRARWSHALTAPGDVQTAYALEAVADEAVFIVGPIIVTVLATTWHPLAGLSVAIACGVAGTWRSRPSVPLSPRPTRTGAPPGPGPGCPGPRWRRSASSRPPSARSSVPPR